MAKKKVKSKGKNVVKPAASGVSDIIADAINSEVIAAAYSSVSQPVFMKLCRLCESKDGPFLNIFDADKVTAKKIEELMPFGVAENDDLPHKICFRCSAKVEELYEFIQKCIKTQESLRKALGNTAPLPNKTKTRAIWEEKLNKSNISNDDICDALIKKAMEGIKDIPLKPLPAEDTVTPVAPLKRTTRNNIEPLKKDAKMDTPSNNSSNLEVSPKPVSETTPKARKTRSNKADTANLNANDSKEEKKPTPNQKANTTVNSFSIDLDKPETETVKEIEKEPAKAEPAEPEKPFNIMDHVSTIKVTGVGVLFQCKLCNRNFVTKKVVESHNCAKNGIPKIDFPKNIPAPEPPKVSTVKYIKMDPNKKSLEKKVSVVEAKLNEPPKQEAPAKVKPKIGPASKVKRNNDPNSEPSQQTSNPQESITGNPEQPSVLFPTLPSLNGRYKLVPGPNNTFTLVEEKSTVSEEKKVERKRKSSEEPLKPVEVKSNKVVKEQPKFNVDDKKPYPVGLFQTVPHHSRLYEPPIVEPPSFTTPAMKKQSYTVVQTGNPSKLLISTKPQPVVEEVPKKRQRKSKPEVKDTNTPKEPFTVTLEDVAPPKDPGFFTFINVDPLLQPSYVLPTDNIIQESQITTSTPAVNKVIENKDKDKYACNMCGESFSREKKLLSHIQSHYTKMDEEDQLRAEKTTKKKGKRQ